MEFPPDPSVPPLNSAKEEGTSESKLCSSFKKTEHRHKWIVSYLTLSDKLDTLYSGFTSGEARAGIDGSYREDLGMSSVAWIIKSNRRTQYIQGGEVVTGKIEDHN